MPRKTLPLAEVEVRNVKPRDKAFKLSDGGGLYLEVLPSGGKSWRMKYRFGGQEKRLVFGLWPDVSLKQARQYRDDARALVAGGVDPGEKRRQDKAEAVAEESRRANTFEVVARAWHAKQLDRWSPKHADKVLARMELHLFPEFGPIPVGEVKAGPFSELLETLEGKGKRETVHRLRGHADSIFAFAISKGLTDSNPASAITKILAPVVTAHRPALVKPEAVGNLLRDIWNYVGNPLVRGCLQLTALTAARPGEVQGMSWDEINLDGKDGPLWVIPAGRTKMRREHMVPLASQSITVLDELRSITGNGRLVFPSNRSGERPMGKMVMNMTLRRLGYGKETHCAHGFRSTFSTLCREAGQPHHVVEAALAHVQGSTVSQAYDRAQYLPERRALLEWWASYLDSLRAAS